MEVRFIGEQACPQLSRCMMYGFRVSDPAIAIGFIVYKIRSVPQAFLRGLQKGKPYIGATTKRSNKRPLCACILVLKVARCKYARVVYYNIPQKIPLKSRKGGIVLFLPLVSYTFHLASCMKWKRGKPEPTSRWLVYCGDRLFTIANSVASGEHMQ
jgi:hypothetical protein